jgi:hypothetical protein
MIVRQTYICELDGKEFSTESDAEKHEARVIDDLFLRCFPRIHNSDTRYKIHCPGCGTGMLEYNSEWDGHRNERGAIEYDHRCERHMLFGAYFCKKCYDYLFRQLKRSVALNASSFNLFTGGPPPPTD